MSTCKIIFVYYIRRNNVDKMKKIVFTLFLGTMAPIVFAQELIGRIDSVRIARDTSEISAFPGYCHGLTHLSDGSYICCTNYVFKRFNSWWNSLPYGFLSAPSSMIPYNILTVGNDTIIFFNGSLIIATLRGDTVFWDKPNRVGSSDFTFQDGKLYIVGIQNDTSTIGIIDVATGIMIDSVSNTMSKTVVNSVLVVGDSLMGFGNFLYSAQAFLGPVTVERPFIIIWNKLTKQVIDTLILPYEKTSTWKVRKSGENYLLVGERNYHWLVTPAPVEDHRLSVIALNKNLTPVWQNFGGSAKTQGGQGYSNLDLSMLDTIPGGGIIVGGVVSGVFPTGIGGGDDPFLCAFNHIGTKVLEWSAQSFSGGDWLNALTFSADTFGIFGGAWSNSSPFPGLGMGELVVYYTDTLTSKKADTIHHLSVSYISPNILTNVVHQNLFDTL